MGLFSARRASSREHGDKSTFSPRVSRLPKLAALFSDSEEVRKPKKNSSSNQASPSVWTPTIDVGDSSKKNISPKGGLSPLNINNSKQDDRAFSGLGRKTTMRQHQMRQSQQISGLQEIAVQRTESLSRIAQRNSMRRSVSRKIARSESRRQLLNIRDQSLNDDRSSGALARRSTTRSGSVSQQRLSISSSTKIVQKKHLSLSTSPISPTDDGALADKMGVLQPNESALPFQEGETVTLNKDVDEDLELNHASLRNFDTLSKNLDIISKNEDAFAVESSKGNTSRKNTLAARNISLATSGSTRSRKRPPPLLANNDTESAPDSTADWPSGACFGSDGGFMTGGFKITEDGMVGKPPTAKRKDSDEADDGVPKSSGKLIIVQSLKEFRSGPTIGSGAGGRVYIAEHLPSKKTMAMKVVNVYDKNKRNQLLKELETLSTHVSRYLVRFHGAFYNGSGAVHIALEYMDHGCLSTFVQRVGAIPEKVVQMIASDCLRGLRFLHRHHVLHRDFKTANILLSRKLCCAKLSDFGLARDLNPGVSKVETFVGTVAYMSPERLQGSTYTYASDIWGLGVSIVECLLGRYPFDTPQNYFDYLEATMTSDLLQGFERESARFSPEVRDFVQLCTFTDPKRRPASNQLLEHPWLKGVKRDSALFGSWLDECRIISMRVGNNTFKG